MAAMASSFPQLTVINGFILALAPLHFAGLKYLLFFSSSNGCQSVENHKSTAGVTLAG